MKKNLFVVILLLSLGVNSYSEEADSSLLKKVLVAGLPGKTWLFKDVERLNINKEISCEVPGGPRYFFPEKEPGEERYIYYDRDTLLVANCLYDVVGDYYGKTGDDSVKADLYKCADGDITLYFPLPKDQFEGYFWYLRFVPKEYYPALGEYYSDELGLMYRFYMHHDRTWPRSDQSATCWQRAESRTGYNYR